MSKAIRSYPKALRAQVISRRIRNETGGIGYWAAVDAKEKGYTVSVDAETELENALDKTADK